MKKLVNVLDLINFWAGIIGSVFFLPLTALMVYEVITRRIFHAPTIWTLEMSRFLFVPLILLALGFTLIYRGHATIDLFYTKWNDKTRAIVDIITYIIFMFPACIIMFINEVTATKMSWATLERTPSAFNCPVYPVKTLMPIGFLLLFIAAVSVTLKNIYMVAKKRKTGIRYRTKDREF